MSKKVWALILCLMLLSGCSQNSWHIDLFGQNTASSALTVYVSDIISDYRPSIHDYRFSTSKIQMHCLQRWNKMVKDNGFNIKFVPIPTEYDENGNKLNYVPTIKTFLRQMDQENCAVLLPSSTVDLDDLVDTLIYENEYTFAQVGEEDFMQWAPNWYEYVNEYLNYYQSPNMIPAGEFFDFSTTQPLLFVRDEVAAKYGETINTLDDYEEFLYWCQKEFPGLTPSVIVYGNLFGNYTLDIMTLIQGSLDGYPLDGFAYEVMGMLLCEDESGWHIKPVEEDQQFRSALNQIVRWREDQLIQLVDSNDTHTNWEGLASLQINPVYIRENYVSNERSHIQDDIKNLRFMMEQTPYVLYNGLYPEIDTRVDPYGLSYLGENTSSGAMQEWLVFLEWMHANRENYRSLMWGEEGTEYEVIDGIYSPIQNAEIDPGGNFDYRLDFDMLNIFTDNRYPLVRSKIIDTGRLQNVIDACEFPEIEGLDPEVIRRNLISALGNSNNNGLSVLLNRKYALADMITQVVTTVRYESVDGFIDEFQRKQKQTCDQAVPILTSLLELE